MRRLITSTFHLCFSAISRRLRGPNGPAGHDLQLLNETTIDTYLKNLTNISSRRFHSCPGGCAIETRNALIVFGGLLEMVAQGVGQTNPQDPNYKPGITFQTTNPNYPIPNPFFLRGRSS